MLRHRIGPMDNDHAGYLSYLLRLWRVKDHAEAPGESMAIWRASLESAHTGERRIFASLDDLFAFLREQADVESARLG